MRDSLRHFTAEFIGTFALVFVGGAAIMMTKNPGTGAGLVEVTASGSLRQAHRRPGSGETTTPIGWAGSVRVRARGILR